jgi:23S rRNA (cytidine1920-2'-O)/16S rRNA (cytidine1409-2'-O)-methyltransferase
VSAGRRRLDVLLVERGLAESRQKAQGLVMAGRVRVAGVPVTKCGTAVADDAPVELAGAPVHVGRGALKLEGALDDLRVDPAGRVCVDLGASTGGFTEVLLARGALRVYAVDVGRGQLHERLRQDPRVLVRDRVNARSLGAAEVPEPCGMAVVDVSFISVLLVLPALLGVLAAGADALVLVKPQFEVGRGQVGRGGLVKEPALHRDCLARAAAGAIATGYAVRGAAASRIEGATGNREFFLHLGNGGAGLEPDQVEAIVEQAVAS